MSQVKPKSRLWTLNIGPYFFVLLSPELDFVHMSFNCNVDFCFCQFLSNAISHISEQPRRLQQQEDIRVQKGGGGRSVVVVEEEMIAVA